jgi:hypothetical protein
MRRPASASGISRAGNPQPFLLYVPLPSPHAPIIPNDEFAGRSQAGPFGDFVVQTDDTCDLKADIGQRRNLAAAQPEKVAELTGLLKHTRHEQRLRQCR